MRLFQSRPSRRTRSAQTLDTRQLLVFRIRQEWFALPLEVLQRVVPMGRIHGDQGDLGIGVTRYEDQELLVLDVGRRIFPRSQDQGPTVPESEQHMVILQAPSGELLGLPIDSRPALKRVPSSAIAPLPAAYTTLAYVQCVSGMAISEDGEQSYFLLAHDRLLSPPTVLE